MDAMGNLYILERGGHALRMVDKDGMIKTVVGTGKAGNNGVGGPALNTELNGPKHLCADNDGTILIADTENHRVLRYDPKTETTSLVAGTGKKALLELMAHLKKWNSFNLMAYKSAPRVNSILLIVVTTASLRLSNSIAASSR